MAIHKKIAKVLQDLQPIQKDGHNQQQNYAYTRFEDVASALRLLFAKHGLTFTPEVEECIRVEEQGSKGNPRYRATLKMRMHLSDSDEGDTISRLWSSEAVDSSDKAINKAITAGIKYFLCRTFLVSDKMGDDDPDAGTTSDIGLPKKPSSDAVYKVFMAARDLKGAGAKEYLQGMMDMAWKKSSMSELTESELDVLSKSIASDSINA